MILNISKTRLLVSIVLVFFSAHVMANTGFVRPSLLDDAPVVVYAKVSPEVMKMVSEQKKEKAKVKAVKASKPKKTTKVASSKKKSATKKRVASTPKATNKKTQSQPVVIASRSARPLAASARYDKKVGFWGIDMTVSLKDGIKRCVLQKKDRVLDSNDMVTDIITEIDARSVTIYTDSEIDIYRENAGVSFGESYTVPFDRVFHGTNMEFLSAYDDLIAQMHTTHSFGLKVGFWSNSTDADKLSSYQVELTGFSLAYENLKACERAMTVESTALARL